MRPLEGVRVVELAHVAAGPFAGLLLADLGADVVKVEPPAGDQMRAWPPFAGLGEERFSHNFASINRNKRSVVADLKNPADLTRVRDLISVAHVVVENYRPGVLDRLGLGYASVSEGHPGLVYCSISGYGLTSPYVDHGAYDVVIQGMSGLMSVTGYPDAKPAKSGVPVGDFAAALYAAYTIAALLPQVARTAVSVRVDCPMLDCLLGISALQTSEYWGTGREPDGLAPGTPAMRRTRHSLRRTATSRWPPATTGSGPRSPRPWGSQNCWTIAGSSPRSTASSTSETLRHCSNRGSVTRSRSHWLGELRLRGVPCGPVNTFGDILNDPHMEATGLIDQLEMPVAGPMPTVVFPVRIEGQDARLDRGAPTLGDHAGVYEEWGVA